jgi:transposase-like protein
MPQAHLPLFPADGTSINPHLSFAKREGRVYYFNGPMPVFSHEEKDYCSFRMFSSQLVEDGNCTQAEIVRAFGISAISMKRYVKKYREGGPARFFQKKRTRSAVVLTAEVIEQAQQRLNAGEAAGEVARILGINSETLGKAIRAGRLSRPVKKKEREPRPRAKASGV